MNIFEDLIDELKEENLLETTVIENYQARISEEKFVAGEIIEAQTALENSSGDFENNLDQTVILDDIQAPVNEPPTSSVAEIDAPPTPFVLENNTDDYQKPEPSNKTKTETYRNRATLEVSGLQIVEHILSGVEREQMKILPKSYNDLEVKKALHSFLQILENSTSGDHAQSEFQLMQETESWYSSLSHRDKHISVAHLRRYCEETRPALSTQALTALARFYRNSPYSESVRSKFDLIVTRLFSKDIEGENKRHPALKREDIISNLTGLYAEWASICLYSTDEEDSELLLSAFKFEDFMSEADNAESFDELIRNDFFNRLRTFKENTTEQFFAPLVASAAIESNIRIGNRYVELLDAEREKGEAEKLENKYGFLHDQLISDSTSKTLQLVELLKDKKELTEILKEKSKKKPASRVKNKFVEKEEKETVKPVVTPPIYSSSLNQSSYAKFSLNKIVLGLAFLLVITSTFFYMKANNSTSANKSATGVKKVNMENSSLSVFIKEGEISNEVFTGTVKNTWASLDKPKKEEILKKILSIGGDRGFTSVQLQDEAKKTVGTAMPDKVKIF